MQILDGFPSTYDDLIFDMERQMVDGSLDVEDLHDELQFKYRRVLWNSHRCGKPVGYKSAANFYF